MRVSVRWAQNCALSRAQSSLVVQLRRWLQHQQQNLDLARPRPQPITKLIVIVVVMISSRLASRTSVAAKCSHAWTSIRSTGSERSHYFPNTSVGIKERSQKPANEHQEPPLQTPLPPFADGKNPKTGEVGGPAGPEPTRFGDWERKGRVTDF